MAESISYINTPTENNNDSCLDETLSLRELSRGERADIAEGTLKILNNGGYRAPGGRHINLTEDITFCINNTVLYRENDLRNTVRNVSAVDTTEPTSNTDTNGPSYPKFEVRLCTTLQAAQSLVEEMGENHVGVLNFASAKNPGGGFRKGSSAQEESLARSSALYLALTQDRIYNEFYAYHRRGKNAIYSHRIIYSPRVTIFKDDNGKLLSSPYRVGIVTSPAPNASVARNQTEVSQAMTERIQRILCAFQVNQHDTLVLGAFGCGVFKNDPLEVAILFRQYLESEMCNGAFKRIIFAITNPEMHQIFQQVFAATDLNHISRQINEISLSDNKNQRSNKIRGQRRTEKNLYKKAHTEKYQSNLNNEDDEQ